MRVSYVPLVTVRFRHSYYADGRSTRDFAVEPAPASRETLRRAGLLFKAADDGFAIVAEVVPDSEPPVRRKSFDAESLRLAFLLQAVNPCFGQITELPRQYPGAKVLHFTNLRPDDDGALHLGDLAADRRVGEPIALAGGGLLNYKVIGKAEGIELSLTDMFGNRLGPVPYTIAATSQEATDLRVDLAAVTGISRGRHTLTDNRQGSMELYYDPDLSGANSFGIVELLASTVALSPDEEELVPAAYRFLDGQAVEPKEYVLQFEKTATRWRYNVIKKYRTNSVELAKLAVTGPFAFSGTVAGDRAIFTSDTPIPLSERSHGIELKHNGSRLRMLPNPDIRTSLRMGEAAGRFVSEVNIYV